jgi:uncharacterized protein (DUF58 family)
VDQTSPPLLPDEPRRRTGIRPSRRTAFAIGAVALATVVLRLEPWVVIVLCSLGAGCLAVDMVMAYRARVRMGRTTLPVLARQVGHPCSIVTEILGGQVARLRQPVPPELAIDPAETEQGSLSAQIVGVHRGVHRLPAPVVRVSGPLGLGTCDHTTESGVVVTVFPDLPRARRLAVLRRQGHAREEGRIRSRLGLGTEFESIREYSPDDDIRQVNWLATARIGRPMTNQYRIDDNRDLLCLVDSGRLMVSPVAGATRLDIALDALAVLAAAADDAGDRVGAVAFAGDVLRQLEPRRRGAEQVVRALFDLEPSEIESDYDRAFQSVAGRKRALVALFTDLVDAAAARTLLSVLPVLARRHVVMVVSCADLDLQAAVTAEPNDLRDVLRASVSLDLLAARRRTIGLLQRMGAVVVEADPTSLGPACATAYAGIKSAGRL